MCYFYVIFGEFKEKHSMTACCVSAKLSSEYMYIYIYIYIYIYMNTAACILIGESFVQ